MVNRHETKVWVERAAFVITDLDANMQGGPASGYGSVEIHEFIPSGQDLCVSLIEAVYNAAGKPQGVYSFLFSPPSATASTRGGLNRSRLSSGWKWFVSAACASAGSRAGDRATSAGPARARSLLVEARYASGGKTRSSEPGKPRRSSKSREF